MKCTVLRVGRIVPLRCQRSHVILGKHISQKRRGLPTLNFFCGIQPDPVCTLLVIFFVFVLSFYFVLFYFFFLCLSFVFSLFQCTVSGLLARVSCSCRIQYNDMYYMALHGLLSLYCIAINDVPGIISVSYTHLTLPTNREV